MMTFLKGLQAVVTAIAAGMLVAVCAWIWKTEERFKVHDIRLDMNRSQIERLDVLYDRLEEQQLKRTHTLASPSPLGDDHE